MWTVNVRFPDELKPRVEAVLNHLNADPGKCGKAKKNDLIVYAVGRVVAQMERAKTPHKEG